MQKEKTSKNTVKTLNWINYLESRLSKLSVEEDQTDVFTIRKTLSVLTDYDTSEQESHGFCLSDDFLSEDIHVVKYAGEIALRFLLQVNNNNHFSMDGNLLGRTMFESDSHDLDKEHVDTIVEKIQIDLNYYINLQQSFNN